MKLEPLYAIAQLGSHDGTPVEFIVEQFFYKSAVSSTSYFVAQTRPGSFIRSTLRGPKVLFRGNNGHVADKADSHN